MGGPFPASPAAAVSRPVAPDLFELVDGQPRLLGSRCRQCGEHHFPRARACGRCGSGRTEPVPLHSEGTLWTWTIQGFRPKSPPFAGTDEGPFRPYGVGYVELPGQLRVEARLTESRPEALRIGMPMRLAVVPFARDQDGTEIVTYAFAPVGAPS